MKDLLTHKYPTEINVLFVASLYQWSEAMQLLTVFTVFQTLNSIWGGGKEKRKKSTFSFLQVSSGPYKFDCSWHF